mgnify:CR=1 FL=1
MLEKRLIGSILNYYAARSLSVNNDISNVQVYKEEIADLVNAHDKGDYLRVLLLSPQLLVLILNKIANEADELFSSMWEKNITDDDKEVYKIVGKLEREQNDKTYIANCLVNYYEEQYWGKDRSKKEFVKYFTKLEDLISLRNEFAHEYYVSKASNRRVKNCSKGALDLVFLFANHEYLVAA